MSSNLLDKNAAKAKRQVNFDKLMLCYHLGCCADLALCTGRYEFMFNHHLYVKEAEKLLDIIELWKKGPMDWVDCCEAIERRRRSEQTSHPWKMSELRIDENDNLISAMVSLRMGHFVSNLD